jgi:exosome complex component RRP41
MNAEICAIAGLRTDGRRNNDLRLVKLRAGVTRGADGSCYYEQGLNKIIAIVHGPQEPPRRADVSHEKGILNVRMVMAPFSGTERRRRRQGDRRLQELETTIRQTFEGVVMLDLYPRSEISVVLHILEADG